MSDLHKSKTNENFLISFNNKINFKEEEGEFYSEGYVATTHPDKYGDVIPKTTIQKIVEKINSRQVGDSKFFPHYASVRHDWVKQDNPDLEPAGKAVSAKMVQMNDGHYGAKISTHHNKMHADFETTKYNVVNGYYPGYSIEYITKNYEPSGILNTDGSGEGKILYDLDLIGYGFASARQIANPKAIITGCSTKEFIKQRVDKEDTEVKEMSEEEIKKDIPAEEPVVEETPKEEEAPKEEPKTEKVNEEQVKEVKEFVAFNDFKRMKESFMKTNLKKQAAIIQPVNAPMMENDNHLGAEIKESVNPKLEAAVKEYKSSVVNKAHIDIQYRNAARLMNQAGAKEMINRGQSSMRTLDLTENQNWREAGGNMNQFEVKELGASRLNSIEVKTTPLASDTNKTADTSYYQSAAETADVYDPIIWSQVNDATTFYGLLKKVDGSNYGDRYGFKAVTSRGTVSGAQAEGVSNITPDVTTRRRLQQPFKYYYAGVAVTGQTIAAARATGGIGDVYSDEIKSATIALLRDMNSDLLTGTEDGFDDGNEVLGLPVLVENGGSYTELYGLARSNYTTLKGADQALSTENISKAQLRAMMRGVVAGDSTYGDGVGGANINDCIFVCHHLQKDKILALFDDAQRFNAVSARAGFEGMATFDGVPIHADSQCTNSVIYLIDMSVTFLAVQIAPTYTEWGNRYGYDQRGGMVKTYFNLVCTAPNHNFVTTGLKTT